MTSLFPPLGQLPVKTSPRPRLLRTFEPRNNNPREACHAAPFWGRTQNWGTRGETQTLPTLGAPGSHTAPSTIGTMLCALSYPERKL